MLNWEEDDIYQCYFLFLENFLKNPFDCIQFLEKSKIYICDIYDKLENLKDQFEESKRKKYFGTREKEIFKKMSSYQISLI